MAMETLVPEFPVDKIVFAAGYEETIEEVPCGFVVVQVMLTLHELAPEAIVQDVGAGVRVPDMAAVQLKLLK